MTENDRNKINIIYFIFTNLYRFLAKSAVLLYLRLPWELGFDVTARGMPCSLALCQGMISAQEQGQLLPKKEWSIAA